MASPTRRNFLLGTLGVASVLGLTACGGTSTADGNAESESQELSQEDMLEQAEELDLEAFHKTDSENEAKAKQEYDGKIFRCTAIVGDINPTYVRVGQVILGQFCNTLCVELSEDELASLSKEQEIAVCGKFQYVQVESRLVDAFIVE